MSKVTSELTVLHQLVALCGFPVRVTLTDPISHERLLRVSGVVVQADATGVIVDCLQIPPCDESARVTIEVIHRENIYLFQTVFTPGGVQRDRLSLRLPGAIDTTQRRRYPRVDFDIAVHALVNDGVNVLSGTLRDLSAGGASLWFDRKLAERQRVRLIFDLGSGSYLRDLQAETLRCSSTFDGRYVVALRFFCQPEQEGALADWVNRRMEGKLGNELSESV